MAASTVMSSLALKPTPFAVEKPTSAARGLPSLARTATPFRVLASGKKLKTDIPYGVNGGMALRYGLDASGRKPKNGIEDSDDMYDDLFKKYGKVVYRNKDQKSAGAEIDDDAESLSFAVALAKVASDVKAAELRVLFVKPLVYWTRFFIIATAFSRPQIDAIGTKMRDLAEMQYGRTATGDSKPNSWTLLDFGDVVVHIFLPPQRAFYNLEEFYGNATPIQLPFENQPFRN